MNEQPTEISGVVETLPAADYHAMRALSSHGMKEILRSPAHYRWWRDNPRPSTEAQQFGTCVHTLVLEPEKRDETFVVAPADAPQKRKTVDKEWWAQFNATAGKRIVLSAEDLARAEAAATAVYAHPAAGRILALPGKAEASLGWIDPATLVPMKARLDFYSEESGGVVADLKTGQDASAENFARTIAYHGHHIQAAHYVTGVQHVFRWPKHFIWIVVETEPPFAVAVYRAGAPTLRLGEDLCAEAARLYAACVESGEWPGYGLGVQDIDVPRWALRRNVPESF